jgi:hypothetical protein
MEYCCQLYGKIVRRLAPMGISIDSSSASPSPKNKNPDSGFAAGI